jgi:hypothetical protein
VGRKNNKKTITSLHHIRCKYKNVKNGKNGKTIKTIIKTIILV